MFEQCYSHLQTTLLIKTTCFGLWKNSKLLPKLIAVLVNPDLVSASADILAVGDI